MHKFLSAFLLCCFCTCAYAQIIAEDKWLRMFRPPALGRQLKGETRWDKQPQSYLELGKLYLYGGHGLKKNLKKARKYLIKARAEGEREAGLLLALWPLLRAQDTRRDTDENELKKSFNDILSLAHEDYPAAQYAASRFLREGYGTSPDEQESLKWLQRAASAPVPVPRAQLQLSVLYHDGYPPYIQKDLNKAFQLALAAAEAEEPLARYNAALMYINGEGTDKNEKLAFKYMRLAAKDRLPEAQMALSGFYRTGTGVKQNDYGAFTWMLNAARQGNARAQEQTALNYLNGYGVPADRKEARFWAVRSLGNGGKNAEAILKQIEAN